VLREIDFLQIADFFNYIVFVET